MTAPEVAASRVGRDSARSEAAWAMVFGLIVLASILRFSGIQAKSLWGDEIVCLAVATGHSWYPWMGEETGLSYSASHYRDQLTLAPTYFSQQLVSLLRVNDQMPPFYYVLVNLWLHLFGTSETALRSLSLLASVASIPVLYALGRQIAGHQVGIYSAWIFALAPFQIAFAVYNRPYALLGFFALLSTLAAVHLIRGHSGLTWLLVYAVTAILGMYTQYLFVWNVVFQVLLVGFYQRHNRPFLVRFSLTCLAVAIAGLAWAPMLLAQVRWSREVGANSWFYWYSGPPSVSGTIISLGHTGLKLLSAGKVEGFCDSVDGETACRIDSAATVISYLIPLLLFGFVFWRMLQCFRARLRQGNLTPDPWGLCLLWGGCVLAGPVIMDVLLESHTVYSHRYFISASGPVYLAVAMALAGVRQEYLRRSIVAGSLAFLLVSSGLYIQGSSPTLMYEVGAREVAHHIDERSASPDDLILVLDPGLSPLDFTYYLKSNPDFARVDVPQWRSSAPDIASQLQTVTSAKGRARIWYLDDRGPEIGARSAMVEWLRTHYVEVAVTEFTNVGVFLFSPRSSIGSTPEGTGMVNGVHGRERRSAGMETKQTPYAESSQ